MSSNQKISYFNTLVFTIITGVASLVLLSLLFFDIGKQFIYFIIAFEVGIFAIIAFCIYKIVAGEMSKSKKDQKYIVSFDQCPDYYLKTNVDGVDYCTNEYYTVDPISGRKFLMKLYPAEINNVETTIPGNVVAGPNTSSKTYLSFPLKSIENDPNITKMEDKCNLVFKEPPVDSKYDGHRFYTNIPWTYATSRCQSLANV